MEGITSVLRLDPTNVGDWYSGPGRYFGFGQSDCVDVVDFSPAVLKRNVIVGGGGLMAKTFHPHMEKLASCRPGLSALIAWGIGESEIVDRRGGFVPPYSGAPPEYLEAFDLVGVRDFGTKYQWAPCPSCMLPHFEREYPARHEIVIYEHKRIPIPIEGFPRLSNNGRDIDAAIDFLASGELVITNSYHGAYWATLLKRKVLCIPNMSKVYRLRHLPVIGRAENWKTLLSCTVAYPDALDECRAATFNFWNQVKALLTRDISATAAHGY